MTTGEDRNTDEFKNWQHCGVWKFPFCHHRAIKLTLELSLNIRVSNSLFRLPSLVNTTTRYVNFSTCCSVLLLTCSVHCVFLALMFIPAWSHAAANRSRIAYWRTCSEDASSTKSSAKSKRLILQLPTVTPS